MWKLKRMYKIKDDKTGKTLYAYQVLLDFLNNNNIAPITCKKVRDVNTGNLLNFDIEDKGSYRKGDRIVVVDDLCDGGGTFLGIHNILKDLEPTSCSLWITHAVQKAGIEKVAAVYDRVYITNSYCDWDKENLPKNVIVHKINF